MDSSYDGLSHSMSHITYHDAWIGFIILWWRVIVLCEDINMFFVFFVFQLWRKEHLWGNRFMRKTCKLWKAKLKNKFFKKAFAFENQYSLILFPHTHSYKHACTLLLLTPSHDNNPCAFSCYTSHLHSHWLQWINITPVSQWGKGIRGGGGQGGGGSVACPSPSGLKLQDNSRGLKTNPTQNTVSFILLTTVPPSVVPSEQNILILFRGG